MCDSRRQPSQLPAHLDLAGCRDSELYVDDVGESYYNSSSTAWYFCAGGNTTGWAT
jgi:hypothetical protein